MQTLKTAVVVVLLMVVVYGAYVAINTPDPIMPDEIQQLTESGESLEDLNLDWDVPEIGMPPGAESLAISQPEPVSTSAEASISDTVISPPEPIGVSRLPKPTGEPAEIEVDSDVEYPRTSQAEVAAAAWQIEAASASEADDSEAARDEKPEGEAINMSLSDNETTPDTAEDVTNDPLSLPSEPVPVEPPLPADGAGLANAIETADSQVAEGRLRDALFTLSVFYGSPDMTAEQRTELLNRLDVLAREVIYSRRHLIEQPYRVRHGETLQQIAAQYQVPWQLLARINDVARPDALPAGSELKVLRGPFRAEVGLDDKTLTLFVNDLYAGQFPVEIGQDAALSEGSYSVQQKRNGGAGGAAPATGSQPGVYLDLGNKIAIHDSSAGVPSAASIKLQPNDARDVQGILSQGSPVTIRR